MDDSLKRWRENVEKQNKKLKALREASIERLHNLSARHDSSPSEQVSEPTSEFHIVQKIKEQTPAQVKKEKPKTTKSNKAGSVEKKVIARTSPKVKKENIEKTSPKVKKIEMTSPKKTKVPELSSLDDYARRVLDTIDNQDNRNSKLKKVKRVLKKLVKKEPQPNYEGQLEDLKKKCENTTTLITELEEKLFNSEKEKIELRSNQEKLIGRLNELEKELEAYRLK